MNKEFQISCIENKTCLACEKSSIKTILDLGEQPLANSYHNGEILEEYPLKLNVCTNCFHLQLSHTVNPDLMFRNYLYVSGTSQTLKNYFEWFATKTLKYCPNAKTVLDIACNDGTQLDFFKNLGIKTYGIDPALNLYETASSKGHKIICDYLNKSSTTKFNNLKFDILTAQNVFAHTKYVKDFLESCKLLMHEESKLFIQTSQANMIMNNEFDTIYHEHISFFNTNSMKTLVESCGLYLNDVFKTDIHGTSYVFVISKSKIDTSVGEMLNIEKENKLYDILTYSEYAFKSYKITYDLKQKLIELKSKNYMLIGYGAAAKGNTLLNFGKIKLDLIIDDNPLKQDLFTPGMNIPIKNSKILETINTETKIAFIPLAWNFYEEIINKIKQKRNISSDLYIKYFPNITIDTGQH